MQIDEYLEAEVMTASSEQLHLMVVNAAVNSIKQGIVALNESRFETSHHTFSEARDYVAELMGGLNPEAMPETVENLKMLFAYSYQQLVVADIQQDSTAAQNALDVMLRHQECWCELLDLLKSDASQEKTAPTTSQAVLPEEPETEQDFASHRHDAGTGMQWEC